MAAPSGGPHSHRACTRPASITKNILALATSGSMGFAAHGGDVPTFAVGEYLRTSLEEAREILTEPEGVISE